MSYQRLAYDEASTTAQMTSDCRAVEHALEIEEFPAPAAFVEEPAARDHTPVVSERALLLARRFLA
jgi:hypothetical protein